MFEGTGFQSLQTFSTKKRPCFFLGGGQSLKFNTMLHHGEPCPPRGISEISTGARSAAAPSSDATPFANRPSRLRVWPKAAPRMKWWQQLDSLGSNPMCAVYVIQITFKIYVKVCECMSSYVPKMAALPEVQHVSPWTTIPGKSLIVSLHFESTQLSNFNSIIFVSEYDWGIPIHVWTFKSNTEVFGWFWMLRIEIKLSNLGVAFWPICCSTATLGVCILRVQTSDGTF